MHAQRNLTPSADTTAPSLSHTEVSNRQGLPSHLTDNALDSSLPARQSVPGGKKGTWFSELQRNVGIALASGAASLGLSGMVPTGMEKQAEGGIIVTFTDDGVYRDNFLNFNPVMGGNTGYLHMQSSLGSIHSSIVFVNSTTAIASAHQFNNPAWGENQIYSIGTSPNFNNPGLGVARSVTQIFIHPEYGGSAGAGIDIAVIKFNEIEGINPVVFADGRPGNDETVRFSGYGVTGRWGDGYLGQDGFGRAGTSRARPFSSPLLDADPSLYMNAQFSNLSLFPNDLRIANGDSGGGTWNTNRELWGINIGADLSIVGTRSMFLSTSDPRVRSFIDSHSAVPEPSSNLLIGGTMLAFLARRRERRG